MSEFSRRAHRAQAVKWLVHAEDVIGVDNERSAAAAGIATAHAVLAGPDPVEIVPSFSIQRGRAFEADPGAGRGEQG